MKKVMLAGCLILISGCSGMYAGDYDLVMLGNEEGYESLSKWQIGTITETRKDPTQQGAYWANADKETAVKGLKFRKVTK